MFILIADDEKMIRLSLQSMLEELYPHEHMYIHASNGQAAIVQVEKFSPDIAFLDIRMPLMNGLEALEACRTLSPSTKWIILSGYADFEYAQKAITLSAYSYLLKPVDLVTLKQVVDDIVVLKNQEKDHNNKLFALDVIRSFNMADQLGGEEAAFLSYGNDPYVLYQIYIDKQEKKRQHMLKHDLFCSIDNFCVKNSFISYHAVFFNTNGELCVICSVKDPSHLTFFINSQIRSYPRDMISVFMGIAGSLWEIYEKSRKISQLSEIRLVYDCRSAAEIEMLEQIPTLDKSLSFCEQIDCFIQNALVGNKETIRRQAAAFSQDKEMRDLFNCICLDTLYLYLEEVLAHSFLAGTFPAFVGELLEAASELSHNEPLWNFDITVIKDFVHQNYGKDVSIAYVSEYFNLSPTYFSKLFHEKTGQKYIDFVTEVRMENAKKLIRNNPRISVKQTAEAVGYTSVRHFSKTFQKFTGMHPSDY